jgi:Thioesterase-like superfamily
VTSAFYLPTGEPGRYQATEHTGGPWDPALQHGGPPSALLARAAEAEPGRWPFTVVRMAVEILGPVPVGEVSVSSQVVRSGRSVELLEAELTAGGRVAVRARAWRIRLAELDLPDNVLVPPDTPPMPAADSAVPEGWGGGFVHSMDFRFATGNWATPGPATMWARFRYPLVAGEESSGLTRLMMLADCGNGVSSTLPIGSWIFINPDLTVHLSRYPKGEWLCIDAATTADHRGFGVATSVLYDASGRVANGAQSLFIDSR